MNRYLQNLIYFVQTVIFGITLKCYITCLNTALFLEFHRWYLTIQQFDCFLHRCTQKSIPLSQQSTIITNKGVFDQSTIQLLIHRYILKSVPLNRYSIIYKYIQKSIPLCQYSIIIYKQKCIVHAIYFQPRACSAPLRFGDNYSKHTASDWN